MLNPFIKLVTTVIELYSFVVLLTVIISLLRHFNVLNVHNQGLRKVEYFLEKLTEPILSRIRKVIPPIAGLDLSPLVLLLVLGFLENAKIYYSM